MVRISLCIGLICLLTHLVSAQDASKESVSQSIQWVAVSSHLKLSKRLSLLLDGQFRQVGSLDPMQYQLRSGLDIKLNDHFSIVPAGYVYTWNYQYGKQPAAFQNNEHRIWQQVMFKHHAGRVNFEHRLRVEERFIQHHHIDERHQVVDDGYTVNQYRLRYRLQARVPINNAKIEPHTYYAIVYDEIFKSWGENVTYENPDQNRIFVGMGYQFHKSFSMHLGGLYQMLVKRNGLQQENNVGLFMQLTYNIDLMKAQ